MTKQNPFKGRHFQAEIILLCVRWYVRYPLSYRDLEEMMAERGLCVDHTTVYRWVQRYAPELEKRCRPYLKVCNDSWKVDETYIKIRKAWTYLYRAVDSEGNTFETAWRTLQGFEVMNMIRKGQLQGVNKGDVRGQAALVARLFGVVA